MTTEEPIHAHVVHIDLKTIDYTHCDDCGEPLPFTFDIDWPVIEIIKKARETGLEVVFDMKPNRSTRKIIL